MTAQELAVKIEQLIAPSVEKFRQAEGDVVADYAANIYRGYWRKVLGVK